MLAVSEFAANAIEATPERSIRFQLIPETVSGTIVVAVWDSNDMIPQSSEASPNDERGRGLAVIEALAIEVGARRTEPHGKWLWARFKVV